MSSESEDRCLIQAETHGVLTSKRILRFLRNELLSLQTYMRSLDEKFYRMINHIVNIKNICSIFYLNSKMYVLEYWLMGSRRGKDSQSFNTTKLLPNLLPTFWLYADPEISESVPLAHSYLIE